MLAPECQGPRGAGPTPNLTDGETEAREGGHSPAAAEPCGAHSEAPALGALSETGLPLLLPRGVSERVGSASGAPTDLSSRTAGRDLPSVPGSALPRSQAVQSRLRVTRPEQGKRNGKREAVESEKHQLARAGEAGASRRGIARRAWPAAGRPFCRPQLLLAAPGLGSPPAHRLAPTSALGQPARPALGGPRCLCGKRRQDPAPQLLAWGHPAAGGQRLRASQDPRLGRHSQRPGVPEGRFRTQSFPAWQLSSFPREAGTWALGPAETPVRA